MHTVHRTGREWPLPSSVNRHILTTACVIWNWILYRDSSNPIFQATVIVKCNKRQMYH